MIKWMKFNYSRGSVIYPGGELESTLPDT